MPVLMTTVHPDARRPRGAVAMPMTRAVPAPAETADAHRQPADGPLGPLACSRIDAHEFRRAPAGQPDPMIIVECTRCGDRYEADVSPGAVERIARCRTCGRPALVVVERSPADEEPAR
jgi:hypothetical protein